MLTRIRKSVEDKDQGFTLIELLVVMIIIGILAAIAIPTFLNQKNKAKATSAKNDAAAIGKEIAAYYVDSPAGTLTASGSNGTWSLVSGSTTVATGRLSAGNSIVSQAISSDTAFCVVVQNSDAGSTNAWRYNQTGLEKQPAC